MNLDSDQNLAVKLGVARGLFSNSNDLNSTIELVQRAADTQDLPEDTRKSLREISQRLEDIRSRIENVFPVLEGQFKD